ncbi:response regulator [Reinekea blandensis]|uniref:CheY-like receiver protein n=1 Tax=Reinekea blandensis MED297 TaxID=314283 RepID=A4BEZ9_9GAMM|nr:response regulator [Reinekea blandensis]EAR09334.1 CheY-like receiver protein [Reinekea sp. MED297] [Reinekea blandensis MED297]
MQKLHFLVVDDASFIRDLVKRTLKSQFAQCEIDEAIHGRKAQSLLNKRRYDLVLCDWEMPELSGLEVLQWLREQEREQGKDKTPFIMVTSRGDKSHVVQAVESGVSDYIGKPFSSDQLLKKIFKALSVNHRDLIRAILKGSAAMRPSSGTGNDSAQVLTAKSVAPPKSVTQTGDGSAGLLTAGSVSSKLVSEARGGASAAGTQKKSFGAVQLRSPKGQWKGQLKDITLTGAQVQIEFGDSPPPSVLEQVVIDIVAKSMPDQVARINTFVTSIVLMEKTLECQRAVIGIQIVDDDEDKLSLLSRFIAEHR